ncbi:MAG: class I SAM-dependent methyltransferase [Candidatus Hydrogenedens sp.]
MNPTTNKENNNKWITIHHETEKNYWWFILKREIITYFIQSLLKKTDSILEIGCGGGRLSCELQQLGYKVISTDFEPSAVFYTKKSGITHAFVSNSGEGIPIKNETIDLIVMTDVLEHIKDHSLTIQECHRVLKKEGYIVITVPAYPCLFSSWDRWNKHYRRYTKEQLIYLAKTSHLKIKKLTFWNIPGIPFAIFRKIKDLFNPSQNYEGFPSVPTLIEIPLKCFISMENKWLRRFSLPVGLSLICIFEKIE